MSLRINNVKKVLRDSGVEMDADDILAVMRTRAVYRNLTRVQVAQSLGSLCESDPDIIRTRLGLYQHVNRPLTAAELPILAAPAPRRLTATTLSPTTAAEPPGLAAVPRVGAVVVVERPHLEAALADHAGQPVSVSDPEGAADYLGSLARLRLRRRDVHVAWCSGPIPAAAEATRRQWAGESLILVASPHVVAEAQATAAQLHQPLTVWLPAPLSPEGEPAQTLPLADLLHCTTVGLAEADTGQPPTGTPAADEPAAPASPALTAPSAANRRPAAPLPTVITAAPAASMGPASTAAALERGAEQQSERPHPPQLDCLWFLSVDLYEQPVAGISGTGNTHTLRRQAHQLGGTYARRWWQVATDADHDQLATSAQHNTFDIPDRLYPDLLRFAEQHHLQLHRSTILKDQLRRGFWSTIQALGHVNASATTS